ncbi:MAG: PhzF family phenazine biosynthesis protein [Acidimicrobiales bacterium]
MRPFKQVDVFTAVAYQGNPLAVVLDGSDLSHGEMQRFARWTNLSETTFLLAPTDPAADYRVRIFTPDSELPFAGHPTIGSCHAWLELGGTPADESTIVQQCGAGLVTLRRDAGRLAFAAPPLIRSGSVDEADVTRVCRLLRIDRSAVLDAQWAHNGPAWIAVRLAGVDEVLAIDPDAGAVQGRGVGVVGSSPVGVVAIDDSGRDGAIEVRAFFRSGGQLAEDPVTGSLNAALAQWLLATGDLSAPYTARQGGAMGRSGRVHVDEADGEIWIGGDAVTCIEGEVAL